MKTVYCAKCGTKLSIIRKALPKQGRIIDIVEYHECPDEPVEFDLTPIDIPKPNDTDNNEFVRNLDDLKPQSIFGNLDLRDRRGKDVVKSTAPQSVLDMLNDLPNSQPEKEVHFEETDDDD